MSSNKGVGYGALAGICFFSAVLAHDVNSDKFNMVDHFKIQTENAYRVLFISSLAIGGIGGGGLGAAAKRASNTRLRPIAKKDLILAL